MGFFFLFVVPWLSALSLSRLSDKEAKELSDGIESICDAFVFTLKPFIYLFFIVAPFWGTYVFINGVDFMGLQFQFEGASKILWGFTIFPLYPLSLYIIARIVYCGLVNMIFVIQHKDYRERQL